ncbi:MAG: dicarboxylate/amino acid:cation symporter [Chloroflexi bacterium]|nr:dicarboxylate/amino acid:cation symporter [Chloroflexota bacterium]
MRDVENRLGVGKKVSSIMMRLGVTFHRNGAVIHMAITLITIAHWFRSPLWCRKWACPERAT